MSDLSRLSNEELAALYQQSNQQAAINDLPDDELIAAYKASLGPMDYVTDIAKAGGVGLAKGAIGLGGLLGDVTELGAMGLDKAVTAIGRSFGEDLSRATRLPNAKPLGDSPIGSKAIQRGVEQYTGPFYQPHTLPGHYSQAVGENVAGALAGPGGVARNVVAFGVVPGMASEAAGQAVKGTAAEPWVRAGTALATGGVAGVVSAPGSVAGTVSRGAAGADGHVLQQAEALFQEAQALGIPLTRPEAIQAVTGGATNFGNLQRVVEGQGGMREMLAQRAGRNDQAAGQVFDAVTPAPPNPSGIGPAVGTAAERTVDDVRSTINAASDPYYAAAAPMRLTPQEMAQVRALPGFAEAAATVRNTPQLNRYVAHLPDDSIGFLNEVKKQLDASAVAARGPTSTNPNIQIPAGYSRDATAVRETLVNASRRDPNNPYEVALGVQEQARERYLQPLLDGPIGKIAAKDTTTKKAIEVLFPASPLPNSAQEIETAVRGVAQRNPYAARSLVRAHLEMTFNEATQNLASGANSFGGAKFAAVVRGNPQQAANLEAAVRALPRGDDIWQGVDRFLTILEAQGQRQAVGSQTAFNQEVLRDLRQGKLASEAGSAVLSGGLKLPAKISETVERWRMGRNVDELARLFTDPQAGREFARLARAGTGINPVGSIIRLVGLAGRDRTADQPPKP